MKCGVLYNNFYANDNISFLLLTETIEINRTKYNNLSFWLFIHIYDFYVQQNIEINKNTISNTQIMPVEFNKTHLYIYVCMYDQLLCCTFLFCPLSPWDSKMAQGWGNIKKYWGNKIFKKIENNKKEQIFFL